MTYKELKEFLISCNESYYKDHVSKISDFEFDMKLKELEKMEKDQGFVDPDSPTLKPGSDLSSKGTKHYRKMLSLANTYSLDEISEWFEKYRCEVVVEKKFDGGSASIIFENGKPIRALTRGDGEYGEDILNNVKLLNWTKISPTFSGEVRGELIISKEGFEILNKDKEYQNPRNLLSGSMKLLNPDIFKVRAPYILFKAYYLEQSPFKTHSDSLIYLEEMGFDIGAPFYICKTKDDLISAINTIEKNKPSFDIEIDGAVIKINSFEKWVELGETGKYPRWGRAYKYAQEEVSTTVREIIYQVGMSGKITPRCRFDPVFLDGSEIEYATLNNKEFMEDLKIGIGDTVVVRKAAGIIPECVRIEKHAEEYKPARFPDKCPCCGTELKKKNEEHVDFFCNNPICRDKLIARFFNFTHVMKIDGFSDATVGKLIHHGYLKDFGDLYSLVEHKEKLSLLERMGEKTVTNLLNNLEKSKDVELARFLAALCIPNVGLKVARIICEKYPTIEELKSATVENFSEINGIGEQIAQSIFTAINDPSDISYNAFHKLHPMMRFVKTETGEKLKGKTFCITGKLSEPRESYENKIRLAGGSVASSVSKNTTFLVNNDTTSTSTKNMKAKELGIKIISEEELKELLK